MRARRLGYLAVVAATLVILMLALAPAAFAGGCDEDEEDCGGGDNGAAAGGVGTGAVDISSADGGNVLLTLALAGGGTALIAIGATSLRRQQS